jgi:hypothetical protein
LNLPPAERGRYFDRLHRDYPVRREFHNYFVKLYGGKPAFIKQLQALGFRQPVS